MKRIQTREEYLFLCSQDSKSIIRENNFDEELSKKWAPGPQAEQVRGHGRKERRSNFRRHRRETSAASAPVDRWGLKATQLSILAIHYPRSRAYLGTMARDHEKRNLTKDGNGRERERTMERGVERGGRINDHVIGAPSSSLSLSFSHSFFFLLQVL